jgi:hypothetical protein
MKITIEGCVGVPTVKDKNLSPLLKLKNITDESK